MVAPSLERRERFRDEYWRKRDPILKDRLLWRAQTFRHTVHLLPGQTILELGCGQLQFTQALLQVSRGENPITAVTFAGPAGRLKTLLHESQHGRLLAGLGLAADVDFCAIRDSSRAVPLVADSGFGWSTL